MTIRTTAGLVKATLLGEYDSRRNPSLDVFMRIANSITNQMVACAARKGYTHETTDLELIETLLAAHAYQAPDPGYQSKSTLGASGTFTGQTGMNLDATRFGQLAMTTDASGCLASLNKRATAGGAWLGKPPSEQIPYDQRD